MIKYTILELLPHLISISFLITFIICVTKFFNDSKKIFLASILLSYKWLMNSIWFIVKICITIVLVNVPPTHVHSTNGKITYLSKISKKRYTLSNNILKFFDNNNIYWALGILLFIFLISALYYSLFYAKKSKRAKWYYTSDDFDIYLLITLGLPLVLNYFLHIFNIHIHNKWFEIIISTLLMIILMPKKVHKASLQVKQKRLGHNTIQAITMFIAYFTSLIIALTNSNIVYDLDCLAFIFLIFSLANIYTSIVKINIEEKIKIQNKTIMDYEVIDYNTHKKVKISQIKIDDKFYVSNESIIPIKSLVLDSNAKVSNENINGENTIISIKENKEALSGSINKSKKTLLMQAIEEFDNSYLYNIYQESNKINLTKTKVFSKGQKYIQWIIYIIAISAIIDFLVWMFIIKDTQKAINTMVSIILLTCPCGIGTGLPILFSKYVSNLLSKDVYIKNLNIVDNISNINAIIFDKTGTLTNTNFIFSNFKNINEYNDIIYTMQYYSNHPLSFQIINHLEKSSILDIQNFEEKNKYGITANINNTKYYMGNHLYVNEVLNIKINPSYIVLFDNNQVLAYFKISNTMINNSSETITLLKKQFKIGILSGDIKENVSKVANKLGINNFQYSKSNIEKKEIIDKLSKTNHVMYVGDGLNDTLAANSSDISVSFKHGNEINTSYSDIVLLNHDLNLINETINYTKFTQTILNTIIIFTLLYNFIFIILASLNLISMGLAPLGEVFTTLIIIIFIVIITIKNK